jgi:branched-chain amino acid transport system permease protein
MQQALAAAVSIVFDGFAYAMLLFMISVGLSVTMGLMGFANLAHGAFAMVGGYVTVTLMNAAGVPFLLALVLAFFIVAVASVPFERVLYRPLLVFSNSNVWGLWCNEQCGRTPPFMVLNMQQRPR